jgi:hypothetical protein
MHVFPASFEINRKEKKRKGKERMEKKRMAFSNITYPFVI